MTTLLYSELIRRVVKNPAVKKKSKLVEIVAKKRDKYWQVIRVKIECGLIAKKGMYVPPNNLENVLSDEDMKLKKGIVGGKKTPPSGADIFLSKLNNEKVLSADGKELGRIYDFEIYVTETPWRVWKILVKPVSMSPLKKRLRIPVNEVQKITSEGVFLEEGWIDE